MSHRIEGLRISIRSLSSSGSKWSLGLVLQAVSLFGLAACVVSGGLDRPRTAGTLEPLNRLREDVPAGCAIGASGPTVNPNAAIRSARLSAIESLSAGSLAVDVRSISGIGPDGAFELAAQALSGTLRDARVLALWADVDQPDSNRARIESVYALACWPGISVPALPERAYPAWIVEPSADASRICATGIAGPTLESADQAASALRDARTALAVAVESRIELRVFDDGHGIAQVAREIDPSPAALARAASVETLEETWSDERGRGPIGLPGVLYGLACIED